MPANNAHRKKILQYGLGEILLPIIRRVIF
jgi:hypothetical protein